MGDTRATALVDQHGHGVLHGDPALGTFERHLARAAGLPDGASGALDSATGRAVRRWCPPLLGLDADVPAVRYLARRRELGAYAAGRLLLRGSGITAVLLADAPGGDGTAEGEGELTGPDEMASATGGTARPLAGLTALAARAAAASGTARSFLDRVAESLVGAARDAAAFVCDIGTAGAPGGGGLPEPTAVRRAADRWLADPRRPAYPGALLTCHLLWGALATGRPVQLRCGDPVPLTPLLHATAGAGRLVLLPDRAHHRAAARLASVFPHVYADAGPDPADVLAEAPPGKLLFSTRAGTLPELYVVRARLFLRALDAALDGRPAADAARAARQVTGGTARQVYGLGHAGRS